MTGRVDPATMRRCRRKLRELRLPNPFSLDGFVDRLEVERGRPIVLHAVEGEEAESMPCGVWVVADGSDHVYYDATVPQLHATHIILHELCHMVWEHPVCRSTASWSDLLPDIDLGARGITGFLARSMYHDQQEVEAEVLAGLILESALREPPSPQGRIGDSMGLS